MLNGWDAGFGGIYIYMKKKREDIKIMFLLYIFSLFHVGLTMFFYIFNIIYYSFSLNLTY